MSEPARTALVVDDNLALLSLIEYHLQKADFDVTVAANGQEGWELAQHQDFDLVVTDEQMPLMTGTELVAKLRGDARYAQTPIVMATAKTLEMDLTMIREDLGVNAIVVKPFSPSELIGAIDNCMAAGKG